MGVSMRIDFSQLEKFITGMGTRIAIIPNNVKRQMIVTAADYVRKEVWKRSNTTIKGPYWLGTVAGATFVDNKHLGDLEPYVEINFKGTTNQYFEPRRNPPGIRKNSTRRIAEVAFLNEYGVPTKQKPRNFLLDSLEVGIIRAMDDLEEIIMDYIIKQYSYAVDFG